MVQKREEKNQIPKIERSKNRTQLIIEKQAKKEEAKVPF